MANQPATLKFAPSHNCDILESNGSSMANLIFYDGDGGGFGAHVRHLAHLNFISERCNLKVFNASPLLDAAFNHYFPKPYNINVNNSILLEDFFNQQDQISYSEIRNFFYSLPDSIEWVLSGLHAGPSIWRKLERLPYIDHFRIMQVLLENLNSKILMVKNKLKRLNINTSNKFLSIHLRTFSDGIGGADQNWRSRETSQLDAFHKVSLDLCLSQDIHQVFIASDNIQTAYTLKSTLEKHLSNVVVDTEPMIHSSSCRVFGQKVLLNCRDLSHQVSIVNESLNTDTARFTYLSSTLDLILALSEGDILVGSNASIAPLAASIAGKAGIFMPSYSESFSNPICKGGPYC